MPDRSLTLLGKKEQLFDLKLNRNAQCVAQYYPISIILHVEFEISSVREAHTLKL